MIKANFVTRHVFANGERTYLSPKQFLIFSTVWMRGRIAKEAMHDIVWGLDPNGGPSWDSMATTICYLNQRIKSLGYFLASDNQVLELKAVP